MPEPHQGGTFMQMLETVSSNRSCLLFLSSLIMQRSWKDLKINTAIPTQYFVRRQINEQLCNFCVFVKDEEHRRRSYCFLFRRRRFRRREAGGGVLSGGVWRVFSHLVSRVIHWSACASARSFCPCFWGSQTSVWASPRLHWCPEKRHLGDGADSMSQTRRVAIRKPSQLLLPGLMKTFY